MRVVPLVGAQPGGREAKSRKRSWGSRGGIRIIANQSVENQTDYQRYSVSPGLPRSQEEDTAHGQVGEQHEEPHGRGEGVEEGEVARLAALMRRHRDGQSDRQAGARRQGVSALHCTTGGQCPSLYLPTKSLQCCCSCNTLMPQSIDARSHSGPLQKPHLARAHCHCSPVAVTQSHSGEHFKLNLCVSVRGVAL